MQQRFSEMIRLIICLLGMDLCIHCNEVQASLAVDKDSQDSNDGQCGNTVCALHQAITCNYNSIYSYRMDNIIS